MDSSEGLNAPRASAWPAAVFPRPARKARERFPAFRICLLGNEGARIVKRAFFTVIVCLAAIAFLALYLADREIQAGIRRLSDYHFPPRSALQAEPGVSLMRRSEPGQSGLEPI